MSKARIRDFMSSNVTSVTIDTPLSETIKILHQQQLSSIVIVEHGLPIGILSESDACGIATRLLEGAKAPKLRDAMSSKVVTVHAEKCCEHAAKLMLRHKIRHLVAVDATGLLCGLFNQSDLLRARKHDLEQLHAQANQELHKQQQQLDEYKGKLKRATREDSLLPIGNRVAMDEALSYTAAGGAPYSIAMIDIDHFKRYNDYYNHAHGDEVLLSVCFATQQVLRGKAQLFRQSGNTLMAIFGDEQNTNIEALTDKLLKAIRHLAIPHTTAPLGVISISIGLASCHIRGSEPNHVVYRALQARDQAKSNGGNQMFEDTEHQVRAA